MLLMLSLRTCLAILRGWASRIKLRWRTKRPKWVQFMWDTNNKACISWCGIDSTCSVCNFLKSVPQWVLFVLSCMLNCRHALSWSVEPLANAFCVLLLLLNVCIFFSVQLLHLLKPRTSRSNPQVSTAAAKITNDTSSFGERWRSRLLKTLSLPYIILSSIQFNENAIPPIRHWYEYSKR